MIGFYFLTLLHHKFTASEKKIIFLASLGGFLVFYDFVIFGLYALYFSPEIFPAQTKLESLVYVYIVFGIGFLLKPVGIFFSHLYLLKDNSNKTLMLPILFIGVSTIAMGLIPTHAVIGSLAGWLMLSLRLIQGIASGAEEQGTINYIHANLAPDKTPFSLNGIFLGAELGGFFALAMNQILAHSLSLNQILLWGWRIPFIIGGLLSVLCCYIRYKLKTVKYQYTRNRYAKYNLFIILRNYIAHILVFGSAAGLVSSLWINCIIYIPVVLYHKIDPSYRDISALILYSSIYAVVATYIINLITRKINPPKLLKVLLLLSIPSIIFSYHCLALKSDISLAVSILIIFSLLINRLVPMVFLPKLFPQQVRLAGVVIGVNTGYALFGIFSPLIIIGIIRLTDTYYIAISGYLIFVTMICMLGLIVFEKLKV